MNTKEELKLDSYPGLSPVSSRFRLDKPRKNKIPNRLSPGQVTLTLSVEIQPADATPATDRILPDPGVYRASLPLNVARKPNVHR